MTYVPFVMLGLVGLFFFITGVVTFTDAWAVRGWTYSSGLIKYIEIQKTQSIDGDTFRDKVHFEFFDRDIQYQGDVVASSKKYRLGQSLKLRYDPNRPSDYRVEFRGQTIWTMVLSCAGIALLVASYIYWPVR
jgi:Protein of unknown function (DUF3592)